MIHTKIKYVWELFYVNPEMIADADNAQEVINHYSDEKQIPVRVLEMRDHNEPRCIVLAGEGALYPWKVGQCVEIGFVNGVLRHLEYLRELCIRGIDNSPYQEFVLYDEIKPIKQGHSYPDKDAVAYKGILSFEIYTTLAKYIIFKDDEYFELRQIKSNMKNLIRSIDLPQESQFRENWEFETSEQCYDLDTDIKNMKYFRNMEDEDKGPLIRKMENFFEERGVHTTFARNYAMLSQALREMEEEESGYQEPECYFE